MNQGRRTLAASVTTGIAMGMALLLRFPPAQYGFYPRCPVYTHLHLLCPGCGATRSLAALLHGNLQEALHLNALFVILLPFVVGYAALCLYRAWTPKPFQWPNPPLIAVQFTLGCALLFTIFRNFPL